MEGCLNAGATIDEIMETLKIVVIGGGSITYPNARFAMHAPSKTAKLTSK
ncbi:hypothetical protein [Peribacillus simplex]|nr:hypothetical protein [Peribacillus simplex]MDR4928030.1 hypothetical protein [Peribacillus simplex]